MKFKEPIRNNELEFTLIHSSKLKMSPFQRDESSALAKKILKSVARGFIVPLVVVPNEDDTFSVVDGQHRLLALLNLCPEGCEVPCIIASENVMNLPLMLNIEKADSLKDKCTKIYKLYLAFLDEGYEDESKILEATMWQPHLATLGFAYKEENLKYPSMMESLTKLLDSPIKSDLFSAVEERRSRAGAIKSVEDAALEVCEEYGINDYNLKAAVISTSKQDLWGRKRTYDGSFEEGCANMVMKIHGRDWSFLSKF